MTPYRISEHIKAQPETSTKTIKKLQLVITQPTSRLVITDGKCGTTQPWKEWTQPAVTTISKNVVLTHIHDNPQYFTHVY